MNIPEEFCKAFFGSYVWNEIRWLGNPILKNPLDLFIYQEIIFETKPDLIIETGTAWGGSALYLASLCDMMKHGKIVTVDINGYEFVPKHPRITYLTGSSTSQEISEKIRKLSTNKKVMVILDSDHEKDHVLEEMRLYGTLVSRGNYMIVEDTCVNGHPITQVFGDGPMEAIEEFMKTNKDFEIDKKREKLLMTFNPNGYLKKK